MSRFPTEQLTPVTSAHVPVPVLVVDDHLAFRTAARSALDAVHRFVVVGEAESGEEAVTLAMRLRPELVVMDVRLPGIDGIEATRRILINDPETVIVLVSTRGQAELPVSVGECGAAGFLPKELFDPEALSVMIDARRA
jgi:two-component system, NarL family, invasion response regulator UvrY